MDKEEIIRRLKNISGHAVHVAGELPFIMSLDDGIALDEAVRLLKEREPVKLVEQKGKWFKYLKCGNCHAQIPQNVRPNYCSNCGRAVKWE